MNSLCERTIEISFGQGFKEHIRDKATIHIVQISGIHRLLPDAGKLCP
jgi:hypothetical protein